MERGKAIYEIFDNHINQLSDHGLSIIDAATGYGKSFQARKYIAENIKNKKFIFLAPQKKLFLDLEDSKYDFMKVAENILGEKPIVTTIVPTIETFESKYLGIVPDEIYEQIDNREFMKKLVKKINSCDNDDKEFYKKTFEEEELKFRYQLIDLLKSCKPFKKKKNSVAIDSYNKKEIIEFFEKHKWIQLLYPSVLLPYANFAQMTIQKAYFPIDTLWFGQHELSNAYDHLFKNYIIFVDEFDTTKEMLQSIIISNITNKERVNLFKTITYIYNSIDNICNKDILPSDFYGNKKEEIYNDLKTYYMNLKEGYDKYKLNSALKFIHNDEKDRFLFRDKNVIDVTRNKGLVLNYDQKENVNYVDMKKNDNEVLLENVCEFIFEQLNEFTLLIAKISRNYFEYTKINNTGKVYSLFEAISTIIAELNIGKVAEDYFSKQVYKYLTFNLKVNKNIYGDFLDFGFQYFCMENNISHDLSTNVYYYHFNELPEHFIVGIATNNIVVGLSATATLSTYVKNYDINFICKKLGDHFIQINQDEIDLLKKDFKQKDNHVINLDFVHNQPALNDIRSFENRIREIDDYFVLNNIDWNDVFNSTLVNNGAEKSYRLQNYYNLIQIFEKYCENRIHGFIYFMNFRINKTDEIKFDKFKTILENMSIEKNHKCSIYVLDSKNFDIEYEKIKKHLKENNAFIISTYKTLALGKNLQYKINENDERDLDGIYLDNVSYALPSVEEKNTVSLAEYLYSIEYLKSELIINSYNKFQSYITQGFKRYLTGKGYLSVEKEAVKTKDTIIAKYAIQSIGRLCRTSNKMGTTYIYLHENIKEALIRKKEELLKRMLNYEFYEILEKLPNYKSESDIQEYIIDNNFNNTKSNRRITYLSYNWWTDLKKSEWINLRELTLKFPVKNESNINDMYYCVFEDKIDSYKYQISRMSENKIKFYNISSTDIQNNYSSSVSFRSSRLHEMLKSKYVFEYFDNHGYATSFEKSNYILNPAAFQRIYKGAIGEVAIRAILEAKGLTINEITDNKYFEKFDYCNGNVYYDMKNWDQNFTKLKKELLKKIINKAKKCNAKRVFIINMLKTNYEDSHGYMFDGDVVYEIPWLYDSKNDCYNEEAINLMRKAELEYGNTD